MPYLDLDQADIDEPTQHSLDRLLAPMLWPSDADSQARYINASLARQAYEDANTLPPHPLLGVPVMPAAAVALVYEARDSIRHFESKKFEREFIQQLDRGMFVGQTLSETIGARDLSLKVRGRAAVGLDIIDDVDAFQFSDRTAERVWGDFAPVAHLWAAYVLLLNEAKLNGTAPPKPPCRASQLGLLLAHSEALLERGETTKSTPKAPAVIVKPGSAYRVSPELVLPKASIHFELK